MDKLIREIRGMLDAARAAVGTNHYELATGRIFELLGAIGATGTLKRAGALAISHRDERLLLAIITDAGLLLEKVWRISGNGRPDPRRRLGLPEAIEVLAQELRNLALWLGVRKIED